MNSTLKFYFRKNQIAKDKNVIPLSTEYLKKAKNNLVTMSLLSEIQNNPEVRNLLKIPNKYDSSEWVVITAYYAMYSSALALLVKIGLRSKNHTATILILEEYFVKRNYLEKKDLLLIKNTQLRKEEIEKISGARQKREIAQYSITKQTTKNLADEIKKDAYDFVNKIDSLFHEHFRI